mmetsp:Transcript_6560/g.16804  ORF Transcript_6560/g.16804 Transcript_6560/m.16804 type:complete len:269 (+) Transcript_6560:237-1043(+)
MSTSTPPSGYPLRAQISIMKPGFGLADSRPAGGDVDSSFRPLVPAPGTAIGAVAMATPPPTPPRAGMGMGTPPAAEGSASRPLPTLPTKPPGAHTSRALWPASAAPTSPPPALAPCASSPTPEPVPLVGAPSGTEPQGWAPIGALSSACGMEVPVRRCLPGTWSECSAGDCSEPCSEPKTEYEPTSGEPATEFLRLLLKDLKRSALRCGSGPVDTPCLTTHGCARHWRTLKRRAGSTTSRFFTRSLASALTADQYWSEKVYLPAMILR